MDFATRDRYRHAVEEIARRSRLSEYDVARKAIQLAAGRGASRSGRTDRTAHVGYYLIDHGRPALERSAEMRLVPADAWRPGSAGAFRCSSTCSASC